VQPRDSFKEDFVYLLTFPNISDAGILITIFNLAVIKASFFFNVDKYEQGQYDVFIGHQFSPL